MARTWQFLGSGGHEERRPKSSSDIVAAAGQVDYRGLDSPGSVFRAEKARLVMRKVGLAVMVLGLVAFVAGPAFSEDGAAVYKAKCAMCHGENGVAKKMAEPSRNFNDPKFQAEVSKDDIVKILT